MKLYQMGINVGEVLYGYSANSDILLYKVMNQSIAAGEYLNVRDSIDLVICVGSLDDYSDQNQIQKMRQLTILNSVRWQVIISITIMVLDLYVFELIPMMAI